MARSCATGVAVTIRLVPVRWVHWRHVNIDCLIAGRGVNDQTVQAATACQLAEFHAQVLLIQSPSKGLKRTFSLACSLFRL